MRSYWNCSFGSVVAVPVVGGLHVTSTGSTLETAAGLPALALGLSAVPPLGTTGVGLLGGGGVGPPGGGNKITVHWGQLRGSLNGFGGFVSVGGVGDKE